MPWLKMKANLHPCVVRQHLLSCIRTAND
jgi:hypothetical protein